MATIHKLKTENKPSHIIFDLTAQEWKFFVHFWISRFWALAGIWVIFLTANGLTLTQVAIVEMVFMGSIFLFEVPTGIIADKFGRKNSLILAYFTQFVGIMMFAFSTSIIMFALAFGIWGVGMTMNSGADQAWIYDEIKFETSKRNLEDQSIRYQRVYGLLLSVGLISTSLSYVVGGYAATFDLKIPIIITSVMFLFTTIWLVFIKENNNIKKEENEEKRPSELKQAIKNFKSIKLVLLTSVSMLLGGIVTAFFYWMQPYLMERNVEIQNIGWLLGLGVLVASFGSSLSSSLTGKFDNNSLLALISATSIAFLLMSFVPYLGLIGLFFVIRFLRGAFNPYLSRLINDTIPSESRATTISLVSAFTTFSIMIISLISAWMIDSVNFALFYISAGIVLLALVPLLLAFKSNDNSNSL